MLLLSCSSLHSIKTLLCILEEQCILSLKILYDLPFISIQRRREEEIRKQEEERRKIEEEEKRKLEIERQHELERQRQEQIRVCEL